MAHPNKILLKDQVLHLLAECVLTTPTTAIFNGFPDAPEIIPIKLRFFGDGYEYQTKMADRNVWAIPIMGGEFILEEEIGCIQGLPEGTILSWELT